MDSLNSDLLLPAVSQARESWDFVVVRSWRCTSDTAAALTFCPATGHCVLAASSTPPAFGDPLGLALYMAQSRSTSAFMDLVKYTRALWSPPPPISFCQGTYGLRSSATELSRSLRGICLSSEAREEGATLHQFQELFSWRGRDNFYSGSWLAVYHHCSFTKSRRPVYHKPFRRTKPAIYFMYRRDIR
jgi:hypothetical protein